MSAIHTLTRTFAARNKLPSPQPSNQNCQLPRMSWPGFTLNATASWQNATGLRPSSERAPPPRPPWRLAPPSIVQLTQRNLPHGPLGWPRQRPPRRRHSLSAGPHWRRLLASGDLASALNAAKAVTPRLEALGAELAAIEAAIFKHRLDAVMADVVKVYAETIEAATRLSEATASLYGFDRSLTQLQSTASDAAPPICKRHERSLRFSCRGVISLYLFADK
jgi:hypothetical protein